MSRHYVRRPTLDDVATARLRACVVDLVEILLAAQGLEVERLDDGRRPATALEIRALRERAAVVVHVEQVIG